MRQGEPGAQVGRRGQVVGAVIAVAVVAAGGLWVGMGFAERGTFETADADEPDAPADIPEPAEPAVEDPVTQPDPDPGDLEPLSPQRARQFEQALTGRDVDTIVDTVVLGEDDDPQQIADEALPDGAELHLDEDTFEPAGENTATVDGRIDGDDQSYTLVMLLYYSEGRWWLAGSDEPQPVP